MVTHFPSKKNLVYLDLYTVYKIQCPVCQVTHINVWIRHRYNGSTVYIGMEMFVSNGCVYDFQFMVLCIGVVCFGTYDNQLCWLDTSSLPTDNRIVPARNGVCICLPQVAGVVSVIWMIGIYLIAFAPWLHIPVYVGPLVMYGLLLSVLCLPLPVLHYRSRLWLLKTLVSGGGIMSHDSLLCCLCDISCLFDMVALNQSLV